METLEPALDENGNQVMMVMPLTAGITTRHGLPCRYSYCAGIVELIYVLPFGALFDDH